MDDVDLHILYHAPLRRMAACMQRIHEDKAVNRKNPAFVIFDPYDNETGTGCRRRRRAIAVGTSGFAIDGQTWRHPEVNEEEEDEREVFVQYRIEPGDVLMDVPTLIISIPEGKRVMSEREGFRLKRELTPSTKNGVFYCECLQRSFYRSEYKDIGNVCTAAALEGVWFFYELWGLDIETPIHVTAFLRHGVGQIQRECGPLFR